MNVKYPKTTIGAVLLIGSIAFYAATKPAATRAELQQEVNDAEWQANIHVFYPIREGRPLTSCTSTLHRLERAYRAVGRDKDATTVFDVQVAACK